MKSSTQSLQPDNIKGKPADMAKEAFQSAGGTNGRAYWLRNGNIRDRL